VLTLTSEPFAGSVAVVKVPLPLVKNYGQGSGTITGPVCALKMSLGAEQVVDISGSYAGSLAAFPQIPVDGSATLTMIEGAANAHGQFPLQATLEFESKSCSLSTMFSGVLTGPFLHLDSSLSGASISGVTSATAPTGFTGTSLQVRVPAGVASCPSGFYGGPLIRQ